MNEFAHAGGPSSPLLSQALDMAATELRGPLMSSPMPAQRSEQSRLMDLNPRHRAAIMADALLAELQVDFANAPNQVDVAQNGNLLCRLSLMPQDPDAFWAEEIRHLHDMKWQRNERLPEIVVQQTDIMSFYGLAVPMGYSTHAWTMGLLNAVHDAVFRIEAHVKFAFSTARPIVLSRQINPAIQTPAHSSFPSGHSTEAFALSAFIGQLYFGAHNSNLVQIADRIAVNRSFAGVHYLVDNAAGATLGHALGTYFAHRVLGSYIDPRSLEVRDNGYATSSDIAAGIVVDDSRAVGSQTNINANAPSIIQLYGTRALGEIQG